jgi:protein-histidine N-methyltransferase
MEPLKSGAPQMRSLRVAGIKCGTGVHHRDLIRHHFSREPAMTVHAASTSIDHATPPATPKSVELNEMRVRRFLRWMEENGASFSPVALKVNQDGRHVYATRPLRDGELAIHIPRKLMITPAIARESAIGKLIAAHCQNAADHDYLAAFLLEIKHEGGFWKPYVDVLPTNYSHIPLNYSENELDALKGTYIFPVIRRRREKHKKLYEKLPAQLKSRFTQEEFTWATCVATSRAYGVTFAGVKTTAMVPLADMFDHALVHNLSWPREAETGLVIAARMPIEAGAPLHESYGRLCNARMLNVYGCRVDGNPDNLTELVFWALLPDHPSEPLAKKLGQVRAEKQAFRVFAGYDCALGKPLFAYLRLACLDSLPEAEWRRADTGETIEVPPIGRDNEIAALTMLAEACQDRLRQFPTSIDEDNALLKDHALSRNMRNIILIRHDEKTVLNYFLELAKAALPLLKDASCDLSAHAVGEGRYADYFAELAGSAAFSVEARQ